jgi:hypothetical protein
MVSKPIPQRIKYVTDRGESYPHSYTYGIIDNPRYGFFNSSFGEFGQFNIDLPKYYEQTVNGFIPDPDGLSSLKNLSYRKMLPVIKAELSSINSFIELKDFGSLPNTIRNLTNLPGFLSFIGRFPGKTLRQVARLGSDAYLQAKFNILPLLSDISGIHTALDQTMSRLNQLVAGQGQTRRRHYTFLLDDVTNIDDLGYSTSSGNPSYHEIDPMGTIFNRRQVVSNPSVFHAEIEYNYNYTKYQLEHARVLSFLDAIGVNLNPAIIWNAIPWSFVVDWVIGIGQWLDSRKRLNMEPLINIHRYLWSITRHRTITVSSTYVTPDDLWQGWLIENQMPKDFGPLAPQKVQLPSVSERAYKRVVEPFDGSSLTVSGLNPSEFSLSAALVLTRRSKIKRKRW